MKNDVFFMKDPYNDWISKRKDLTPVRTVIGEEMVKGVLGDG